MHPPSVQLLVIHSLVSSLPSRLVHTRLFSGIKKGLPQWLHIPFNDKLWISLCFLHFIYLAGATFDINTTQSTWNEQTLSMSSSCIHMWEHIHKPFNDNSYLSLESVCSQLYYSFISLNNIYHLWQIIF